MTYSQYHFRKQDLPKLFLPLVPPNLNRLVPTRKHQLKISVAVAHISKVEEERVESTLVAEAAVAVIILNFMREILDPL